MNKNLPEYFCDLHLEGRQHWNSTRRQSKPCPIKNKHEFATRMLSHSIPVVNNRMPDIIVHQIFTHSVSGFN